MSRASRIGMMLALISLLAFAMTGCVQEKEDPLAVAEPTEDTAGGITVLPDLSPTPEGTNGEGAPLEASPTEGSVTSGGGLAAGDPTATPEPDGEGYPGPGGQQPSTPAPGDNSGAGLITPEPEATTIAIASPEAIMPTATEEGAAPATVDPTATSAPAAPTQQSYTVQAGDTLFSIANRFGTTVDQLRTANNLTTNFIYVGQQLTVPGQAAGEPGAAPAGSAGSGVHVVQRGEWLHAIARKYNTTAEAIMRANGLTNPNLLYVGQRLTIPGQGAAQPSGKVHTVQRGETLFSIAMRYGTTVEALKSRNALTGNIIYVGQQLAIP